MSKIEITEAQWLLVQSGRLVLLRGGKYSGKVAAISSVVSQARVLVDGPSGIEENVVPRHAVHVSPSPAKQQEDY
jgi:large subunit ribosomal protein L14e